MISQIPGNIVTMESLVVGKSARMKAVFEYLRVIGNSESTVLITGESGTGKEVTATLIHQNSRRRHHPFVAVSCALFTETLIESELFGHERGAFTGAIKDRPGRFEMAEGGTIFLDDIDDVPLGMQVELLRVLQNRTVERVGGTRTIPINVRVIAGTKRDLRQMVAEGKFREDLYYRLNVLPVALPPLRERPEDIPVLMEHFLRRFFRRKNEDVPPISDAVMQAFTRYNWPGNVRELENACERIAQTCSCGAIRIGCVSASILFGAAGQPPRTVTVIPGDATPIPQPPQLTRPPVTESEPTIVVAPPAPPAVFTAAPAGMMPAPISLDDRVREFESSLIRWALRVTHGNKSRAAALLQIKRSTLGDRIARCGLDEPAVETSTEAQAV
ncbi:MAG TPA: sigma-54 dependent transcriptional regulator [Vicinamibacterales bacterium]|nr:sigma-54 dependent transcriptional regulator [Vicinamibacterales bacterium]